MDFGFNPEEDAFRAEVRSFLEKELTPELKKDFRKWLWGRVPNEGFVPRVREFNLKLGEKGWLGISWPKRYGGQEGSIMQELIFAEEMALQRADYPTTAVCMAGPTILRYGSEEQKAKYLPPIARGEVEFALGYTEPEAGSDLAALELRAVEKDDHFLLNGQKTFNTAAHYADYHWLAARTDPEAPKHRGISLFIVDLKSPGITIRPMLTMAGERTNEVFYDDVRVSKENLVGEKNKGFRHIVHALNFERLTIFLIAELIPTLNELVDYARKTGRAHDPLLRQRLAQIAIEMEGARLLRYRVGWMLEKGRDLSYESAMVKIFNTETWQHMANVGMQILGLYGQLEPDSDWAQLNGLMEEGILATLMPTFGGGSNEIMRNIIAEWGLGLPRTS
jgi:alkylation response protein AidB-like acyl-CoA dehydrogenase